MRRAPANPCDAPRPSIDTIRPSRTTTVAFRITVSDVIGTTFTFVMIVSPGTSGDREGPTPD
jgi:hypothetical protein